MPKPKRALKSKEQLIKELKSNREFSEKMKFTREVFFPALCEASTSIDDAQTQLHMIGTMMMQKFLEKMKEVSFKDMGLVGILNIEDPKYGAMKNMLELFDDKSVFEAKDMLEGMKNEITLFLTEEQKERTLSELKTKWIDQL